MLIKCPQPSSPWHQGFLFHLLSIWNLCTARAFLTFLTSERTYVQDDVIHAQLRFLLQSSQGLRVLVAQVSVQSNPGTEPGAVVQGSEHEHITPSLVTPTVVHCHHTQGKHVDRERFLKNNSFEGGHSPYVAAGLRPVRVTLWMNIFLFSTPESTNRVDSPLVLISKSRPPRSPYSTLLSALSKVVHVTSMEPGTPVKKVTHSQRTEWLAI